jgi:ADP-heptose:LPS heptosyltransferase
MSFKKIKIFFFFLINMIVDAAVFFFLKPAPVKQRTILLVRPDAIGDFVLWLRSAQAFRRHYPRGRYRIVLLGNAVWTDLAKTLPYWDEVVSIDRTEFFFNPRVRFRMLSWVRKAGFETVIHPVFSREYPYGDVLVLMSGAPQRIGSAGDCSNTPSALKKISDRWYTRLVPATKAPLMEIERNEEFLDQLLGRTYPPDGDVFPQGRLKQIPDEKYFLIFPFSRVPGRSWPIDHFVELIRRILKETQWKGYVCGAPGDWAGGEAVVSQCGPRMKNFCGKISMADLPRWVRGAEFIVGNESGPVHIAAAVHVPCVAILGGGHFGRFLPYSKNSREQFDAEVVYKKMDCFGCGWRCVLHLRRNGPCPCIANVSVTNVWEKVEKLLKKAVP